MGYVAERAGVAPADVLAADLMTHDLTPSRVIGADASLLSAPRLDNLASCYAGMEALLAAQPSNFLPVLALFDHEEVGSTSDHGAQSNLLTTVLERIVLAAGGGREDYLRRLPASLLASADMAHATHPNYPERHEPGHLIEVNAGPVLKVHPNLRYATDSRTAAAFELACRQAGVALQRYEHRADLPCGTTIGPLAAARTGIPTVDVGAAQLAMHSARELMGAHDVAAYSAAMRAFSRGPGERIESIGMTLKVEMVTFDCSDPAKLASWWADQFGGTTQEMIPGEFIAVMRSEGPRFGFQKVPDPTPGKESSAPRFQRRGCGRRSVAADGSGSHRARPAPVRRELSLGGAGRPRGQCVLRSGSVIRYPVEQRVDETVESCARAAARMRQRVEEHRADQCVGDGIDVRVGAKLSAFDGVAESSRQPDQLRSAQLLVEILAVGRARSRRGDQGSHQCRVRRLSQEIGVLVEPTLQVSPDVCGLGDRERS